jgi:hypothetical protein
MMKLDVRNVKVKVTAQYHRAGSVLAGTAEAGADWVRTDLQLDSDAPQDRVAELVRMAEASCYTIGTIREPTPCELAVTLNGELFEVDPPA